MPPGSIVRFPGRRPCHRPRRTWDCCFELTHGWRALAPMLLRPPIPPVQPGRCERATWVPLAVVECDRRRCSVLLQNRPWLVGTSTAAGCPIHIDAVSCTLPRTLWHFDPVTPPCFVLPLVGVCVSELDKFPYLIAFPAPHTVLSFPTTSRRDTATTSAQTRNLEEEQQAEGTWRRE
jgi:hypothetical protein